MNFKIILFMLISTTSISQTKLDSVYIYSSSLDFYMGNNPYEYTFLKFPRERSPLKISAKDTLSIIEASFSKLIKSDSVKKIYVYFIVETFSGNEKKTYIYDDKKQLYFEGRKCEKMKDLHHLFIEFIEREYNRVGIVEE